LTPFASQVAMSEYRPARFSRPRRADEEEVLSSQRRDAECSLAGVVVSDGYVPMIPSTHACHIGGDGASRAAR
jgi:hypothetical protein